MRYTTETFIEKSNSVHGNKYDYSKVEYVDSKTPVCIICPEHGEFWQEPVLHLRGRGCHECGKKRQGKRYGREYYIERAMEVHGGKYVYNHFEPTDAMTPGLITCPIHGDFSMSMNSHVNQGQGCPKCRHSGLTLEDIRGMLAEADGGRYECIETERKNMNDKWRFLCPVHGEFEQSATKHLSGQGCPKCKKSLEKFITFDEFVDRARKVHGDRYEYPEQEMHGYKGYVDVICKVHGEFRQNVTNHLQGCGCPKCANNNSRQEEELIDFLSSEGFGEFIRKDRKLISPYELDVYFPDRRIAIEYDGLRWHSDRYRVDSGYHLQKTELCRERGVRLIHIFEDEWVGKREIVESRLRSIFGKVEKRIYARECEIHEVSYGESKVFLEKSHLQGNCPSKYRYGLYYNGEIVSLMTFGGLRKNLGSCGRENAYELLRFCNRLNTVVVGGASRLLRHFVRDVCPDEVISYCDRRWSDGGMYRALGFSLDHVSRPNYFYVIKGRRENRFGYRKDILIKKYGCKPEMSEKEFMDSMGWYRIYDCGSMVWVLRN